MQQWPAYLKVAIPALVQLCGEWWFWEICALVVGLLHSDLVLAAHVATINAVAVAFMPVICMVLAAAALASAA